MNNFQEFEEYIIKANSISPIFGANIDYKNNGFFITDGLNLDKDENMHYENPVVKDLYHQFMREKFLMEIKLQIITQPRIIL